MTTRAARLAPLVTSLVIFGAGATAQCLTTKLASPAPFSSSGVGAALDASDDGSVRSLIVGGAAGVLGSGAVHVFEEIGSTWTPVLSSFGSPLEGRGTSVAIDGLYAAAGAPGFQAVGIVPLFEKNPSWTSLGFVASPAPTLLGEFGRAVALDGDLLVVGEPGPAATAGRVHVFRRVGGLAGGWVLEATLTTPTGLVQPGDRFGAAVAATSIAAGGPRDAIVVGAPFADNGGMDSGSTYFFVHDGASWTFDAWWYWNQPRVNAGSSVAIDGDQAIVGAPGVGLVAVGGGAATHYRWNGTYYDWVIDRYCSNTDERCGSVALQGTHALLGAPGYDGLETTSGLPGFTDSGGASLYTEFFGTFYPTTLEFYPVPGLDDADGFGTAIAVRDGLAFIGAPGDDDAGTDEGAVYVFDVAPDSWNWTPTLGGSAGVTGEPLLIAEGSLCAGETTFVRLSNANPSAMTFLVAGLTFQYVSFLGGILIPAANIVVPLVTDAFGEVEYPVPVSPTVMARLPVYAQFWTFDPVAIGGWSASNGLYGQTP